jgi:hypothetical protein
MLKKCIEATHLLVNPITQETINKIELRRLEKATGGGVILVNKQKQLEDETHMNLCVALERHVGEVVQTVLDTLEQNETQILFNNIRHEFIPEFMSSVGNYLLVDPVGCIQILEHCMERLLSCKTKKHVYLQLVASIMTTTRDQIIRGDFLS